MSRYKELVMKLPKDNETKTELLDKTDAFVESIKITQPQKYNTFLEEVKKLVTCHHFDKDALNEVYKHKTENYHLEDTTKAAKEEFEIDFTKECFNEYDFNYIMNEMYDLFSTVYGEDINKYAELSIAWLDKHDGRAMKYHKKLYM